MADMQKFYVIRHKDYSQTEPAQKGKVVGRVELIEGTIDLLPHDLALVPDLRTVPGDERFEQAVITEFRVVPRTRVETRSITTILAEFQARALRGAPPPELKKDQMLAYKEGEVRVVDNEVAHRELERMGGWEFAVYEPKRPSEPLPPPPNWIEG